MTFGRFAGETFLLNSEDPASLGNLAVSAGAGLLDFARRANAHVVGLLLGGKLEVGGLAGSL